MSSQVEKGTYHMGTPVKAQVRLSRGGSRMSGKGVHMYKGVGVRFVDFISFSLISHENEIIWSK